VDTRKILPSPRLAFSLQCGQRTRSLRLTGCSLEGEDPASSVHVLPLLSLAVRALAGAGRKEEECQK